MLSAPLILLILAILAAVFGTMVVGPAGPILSVVLLVVAAVMFFKGRSDAGESGPRHRR